MDIRVGQRAQVVIPAALRRQMGVRDGDLLHAELDAEGRLVLTKVENDPVARLLDAGRDLFTEEDAVAYQRSLREEWPASAPA